MPKPSSSSVVASFPKYRVLSDTKPEGRDYQEGDRRVIQYEGDGELPIHQTFYGSTATGGWYDED